MKGIKNLIEKFFQKILKNKIILFFALILFVIFTNQLHYIYPDELENILGGRFVLLGRLPYTGFFTHHNPFAYFFAAIIYVFSGMSFVRFRLLYGLVFFIALIIFYRFIRKNYGQTEVKIVISLFLFISFGATYTWGHMLLADTLSTYFIIPAYIILFFNLINKVNISKKQLVLVSATTALSVFVSMSIIIAALVIYLYIIYLFFSNRIKITFLKLILIISLPYVIFLTYLITTGSLTDFYLQSIKYNIDSYIALPDGASFKNPLRVAIVLQTHFFQNLRSILLMAKDLNLSTPFAHAMGLSNVALILYLIITRQYVLAGFCWLFISFASPRGNPYLTSETDYQAFTYQSISLFNGIAVLFYFWEELKNRLRDGKRVIFSFLLILVGLYQVFLLIFFIDRWLDKSYQKYMGYAPLIYDRPAIAPVLNNLIDKDDYYYIVPFNFEDQLYMKSSPASRYIVILPGMDGNDRIESEIIENLKSMRPKVIVFHTEMRIYGKQPGINILDYINSEYFNLEQIRIGCLGLSPKIKWFGEHEPQPHDFERHFYFDKNRKEEILQELIDKELLFSIEPKVCE